MRVEFLSEKDFKNKYQVKKYCPWACVVYKVEGGWAAFESITDYKIRRRQK